MKLKRLVWVDGRFSWLFVGGAVLCTAALIAADWYWRTHDTSWLSLSRFF